MSWRMRIALLLAGTSLMLGLYVLVIAVHGPSSQSAEIGVVVDGVDPANDSGLRADVLINVPVNLVSGCPREVEVKAMVSGTPAFWHRYAARLDGARRIGIGLRTQYDHGSFRIRDWSGYALPRDLINVRDDERVPNPTGSGKFVFSQREDTSTHADLRTATVTDWGKTWTPLVMEFKAAITSSRSRGSCYLALPELLGLGTPTLDDAGAAATGSRSIFGSTFGNTPRGAVTFGRVIVRTNGRLLDGEARPSPDFVDGNPWVSELGDVGEEAAVWRCKASTARARWPDLGETNRASGEVALRPAVTENDTRAGIAVVEARGAGTFRDATLLIIGGLFSLLFGALVKHGYSVISRPWERRTPAAPPAE